jgi:hypothetical protein
MQTSMTWVRRSDIADDDQDVVASLLKIRAPKSGALIKQRAPPAARTASDGA